MSDPIQRYACDLGDYNGDGDWLYPDPDGRYVLAADAAAHEAAAVKEVQDATRGPLQEWAQHDCSAAVAAARAEGASEQHLISRAIGYNAGYERGQRDERGRRNRTLTADDPEPAVGSVVLDTFSAEEAMHGDVWQRHPKGWRMPGGGPNPFYDWAVVTFVGSVTLIYDAAVIDAAPQDEP